MFIILSQVIFIIPAVLFSVHALLRIQLNAISPTIDLTTIIAIIIVSFITNLSLTISSAPLTILISNHLIRLFRLQGKCIQCSIVICLQWYNLGASRPRKKAMNVMVLNNKSTKKKPTSLLDTSQSVDARHRELLAAEDCS